MKYSGGFPSNVTTETLTQGVFLESFSGCLQQFSIGKENVIDLAKTEVENVESCQWT